eukprot:TRINITY_DN6687_c0_g1_i1.p1 TRINITY_DN6687_c0_g1~~TRINITY_DN6687_c0_g1_i1.p1  ORF type:complete len:116 (+),score=4.10 TRINITY_DN6687_c0_g1_i1:93-440(+)
MIRPTRVDLANKLSFDPPTHFPVGSQKVRSRPAAEVVGGGGGAGGEGAGLTVRHSCKREARCSAAFCAATPPSYHTPPTAPPDLVRKPCGSASLITFAPLLQKKKKKKHVYLRPF